MRACYFVVVLLYYVCDVKPCRPSSSVLFSNPLHVALMYACLYLLNHMLPTLDIVALRYCCQS